MHVVTTKLIDYLWTLALTLGLFYLTTVFGNQNIASPVFQNHKTKEWTSLDNITFEFDCTKRSVGFYADMDYNCQVSHFLKTLIFSLSKFDISRFSTCVMKKVIEYHIYAQMKRHLTKNIESVIGIIILTAQNHR